jgi:hypothetical protein
MAMGQEDWGNGNCNGTGAQEQGQQNSVAMAWQWGNSDLNVLLYVVLLRKTSTIEVDETVRNVWTADIPDVLRSNRTCMF